MKRPVPLLSSLLLIVSTVSAQTSTVLSPGARLLFTTAKSRLTATEKNQVFTLLGLYVSKDKKHFVGDDDATAKFPYDVQVYPADLNQDGSEDVFVLYGNPVLSGRADTDVALFIKRKSGEFRKNLGFPGVLPDVLPTTNLGYPDLLIGGPGFEFLVWRWNGKEYALHRKIKDQDYERTPKTGVEAVSQAYISKL